MASPLPSDRSFGATCRSAVGSSGISLFFRVRSRFGNQKSFKALIYAANAKVSCVDAGSRRNYSERRPTEDQSMATKAKRPAKKKASAKKPAKRKVSAKKVAKKKSSAVKTARKAARSVVKSARQNTMAAKKAGKGIVRRAIKAITDAAAPLLPGNAPEKSNES